MLVIERVRAFALHVMGVDQFDVMLQRKTAEPQQQQQPRRARIIRETDRRKGLAHDKGARHIALRPLPGPANLPSAW